MCVHVRSSGDVPCCTEASCSAFTSSGCHGCKERLFKAQSLNLNESVQMKMTFQFCYDEIKSRVDSLWDVKLVMETFL